MTPHEALELTASAHRKVAERIATPRWWDFAMALSIGAYFVALAYIEGDWTAIVIVLWTLTFIWLVNARRARSGIAHEGHRRQTWDVAWLAVAAVMVALLVVSLLLRNWWWVGAPALIATATVPIAYVGLRWLNRRAVLAALRG